MFSTLRTRFGIPGVISVIALVFAMLGGAYAANNASSGGKATASAKAKKGPRGPKGPKGDTGPAGPQGPAGPAGAKGDTGAKGDNGTNGQDGVDGEDGTDGANGKSVETGSATVEECSNGGATVQVAGEPSTKKAICNGEDGEGGGGGGEAAFPTLPAGKTETGAWWFAASPGVTENGSAIGWSIPLSTTAAATVSSNIHVSSPASPDPACTGTVEAPSAPAGSLCVYVAAEEGYVGSPFPQPIEVYKLNFSTPGVSTSGALLFSGSINSGKYAWGSFAVTAP